MSPFSQVPRLSRRRSDWLGHSAMLYSIPRIHWSDCGCIFFSVGMVLIFMNSINAIEIFESVRDGEIMRS